MASADGDRSLSGISIPKWMRSGRTLDLDQNTFSPPERDDTFMHFRMPSAARSLSQQHSSIQQQQQQPQQLPGPSTLHPTQHASSAALTAAGCTRSRRGSKSLPASPLASPGGSPKSRRKMDRFFIGDGVASSQQGSWILAGLLDTLSRSSVSTIAEGTPTTGSLADLDTIGREQEKRLLPPQIPSINPQPQIYRSKPAEFREMNFWSPTSM